MNRQYEREEQALEDDYNAGFLTMAEFQKELRDLRRSYRAEAEESAENAYHEELSRW